MGAYTQEEVVVGWMDACIQRMPIFYGCMSIMLIGRYVSKLNRKVISYMLLSKTAQSLLCSKLI